MDPNNSWTNHIVTIKTDAFSTGQMSTKIAQDFLNVNFVARARFRFSIFLQKLCKSQQHRFVRKQHESLKTINYFLLLAM